LTLRDRLAAEIRRCGPISVARYMDLCLNDPEDGYYATRPRLGGDGDFVTAPHVSQMFGELLGAWAAATWATMGAPRRMRLVEIGPGDGTMIGDVLRAAGRAAGFLSACEVWLVEPSAPLAALQREALGCACDVRWVATLAELPRDAPVIILANEVLDCLPVRQAVATPNGWRERRVGVDAEGKLAFSEGEAAAPPWTPPGPSPGEVVEWSPDLAAFGRLVGELIGEAGGAALFIDYGRAAPEAGDTLQAIRTHQRQDPLADPGAADLTAHVDFPAFLSAARAAGAEVTAIGSQAGFLRALGVERRADALARSHPDKARAILRQLRRLTAPDQMGLLFKVACVHSANLQVPGLEAA
jgi:NADH dehydrogenase [ubiquinone] 1 alpha subcomplex assembly factor 7